IVPGQGASALALCLSEDGVGLLPKERGGFVWLQLPVWDRIDYLGVEHVLDDIRVPWRVGRWNGLDVLGDPLQVGEHLGLRAPELRLECLLHLARDRHTPLRQERFVRLDRVREEVDEYRRFLRLLGLGRDAEEL